MNVNALVNRSHIHGWELRQGIGSFAHMIAKALGLPGISVEWTSKVSTAAMNNKGVMYLAGVKPDAKVPRALLMRYIGYVVHELLHHRFTEFVKDGNDYVDTLHNAIEDIWIERVGIINKFVPNAESILTELVNQMVDEAMANVKDWTDPRQYPFVLAIYGRTYAKKVPLAEGLQPIFDEAVRRIGESQNSRDNMVIAKWVYEQLMNQPKQTPQQGPDPQQGAGSQGDGDEEEGEGDEGEESIGQAKRPGFSANDVEPSVDPGKLIAAGDLGDSDYDSPGEHIFHRDLWELNGSASPKLRFEVRKLFDNSGLTLFDNNRKAGALNVNALHKVGISDRLFKQRRDIDGIDSAVVLVLDVSGSMGALMPVLADAAWLLADSLRAASVDIAVVTFESQASLSLPFGSSPKKLRETLRRLHDLGGTNDYAGVAMAHDLLLQHPAQRKVAFVISDGEGAPNRKVALREQLQAGERMGITTIGIGLGIDISKTYPKSITVKPSELANATFKQIKLAA